MAYIFFLGMDLSCWVPKFSIRSEVDTSSGNKIQTWYNDKEIKKIEKKSLITSWTNKNQLLADSTTVLYMYTWFMLV